MDLCKIERMKERLLHCAICMDEFKDPRILPCHHTFCLVCISNVVQATSLTGRVFRCPQCREDIHIPQGGISQFSINFYILNLQDELEINGYKAGCSICNKQFAVSQFRCIDCDLDICRACMHHHRLNAHTSSPKVLRIETTGNDVKTSTHEHCAEHPPEDLKLFCFTCKLPVCVICSLSHHKKHDVATLSRKFEDSMVYLQKQLEKLLNEKEKMLQAINSVSKMRLHVTQTSNKSLMSLDEASDRAIDRIKEKRSEIEKMIFESERNEMDCIRQVEITFLEYLENLNRGISFLSDMKESDICLQALSAYKEFNEKLMASHKKVTDFNRTFDQKIFNLSNNLIVRDINMSLFRSLVLFFGKFGELVVTPCSLTVRNSLLIKKKRGLFHFFNKLFFIQFLIFTIAFFSWIFLLDFILQLDFNASFIYFSFFCDFITNATNFMYSRFSHFLLYSKIELQSLLNESGAFY